MKCKCGFEMSERVIDDRISIWKCPLGHKKTIVRERASATHRGRVRTHEEFMSSLEHKG